MPIRFRVALHFAALVAPVLLLIVVGPAAALAWSAAFLLLTFGIMRLSRGRPAAFHSPWYDIARLGSFAVNLLVGLIAGVMLLEADVWSVLAYAYAGVTALALVYVIVARIRNGGGRTALPVTILFILSWPVWLVPIIFLQVFIFYGWRNSQ